MSAFAVCCTGLQKEKEYLKDSFNGDWFPIIHDDRNKIYEKNIVNEIHLKSLHKLISGYHYKKGMGSLFDIYHFSIIPIEFIAWSRI